MTKFQELINSEKPVLIDFYADWCQPCQMMKPILAKVKENVGETAQIIKVDTEKHPELSQSLNIRGIPTLMIFQKGELKFRHSGMLDEQTLVSEINKYVN
ncbi:MAG: thioredoxin [Chitinophagales bacterium]|jgi:thioredoxin 1|nr:thioredoxin [Chitinophagales bacterium]